MEFWDWLVNYLLNDYLGLNKLNTAQGVLNFVCVILTLIIGIFTAYRFVYILIGFIGKKISYPEAPKNKRYAFIISAKNEELVIRNTIESTKRQDYPSELIDIWLVADNCKEDDKTAEIARELGVHVFERHDMSKARKGWGLEFLFDHIKEEVGIEYYDAYLMLDADNVVDYQFVSKMNDAFQTGRFDVVTGYRCPKNFQDNIITSAYGFNFYRITMSNHRPRMILKSLTSGTGSGYLVSSKLLKDGWHWHRLVEDMEFVITNIANNNRLGYTDQAICYDEQPTNFWIQMRQRFRWNKGSLIVWLLDSGKLIKSFFKKPTWAKYDIYWDIFPYPLITFLIGLVYNVTSLILGLTGGAAYDWSNFLAYTLTTILGICVAAWFAGILICIKEWKNIHCSLPKAILYTLVWPWYDLISIPISIISLFFKVKWKQIPHKDSRTIEAIEEEMKQK